MNGDVRHFRRKVFGGFDSRDVMRYIEELAGQRNRYKMTGEKLESELKSLNAEIKKLQSELDDTERRITDIKVKALDASSRDFSVLRDAYTEIRSEMETTASSITSEISNLNSSLTVLTSVLDKTGERFSELQAMMENEKAELLSLKVGRLPD
jgi:chromosome segregation ATPase